MEVLMPEKFIQGSSPETTDPDRFYKLLLSFHEAAAGFTTAQRLSEPDGLQDAMLGLQSALPDCHELNNAVVRNVAAVRQHLGTIETMCAADGIVPAVYFASGPGAEDIRKYLITQRYEPDWEDTWMAADGDKVLDALDALYDAVTNNTVGIRVVENEQDIIAVQDVLREAHSTPRGLNNPYGFIPEDELKFIGEFTKPLIGTNSPYGQCVIIETRGPGGAEAAAVATVRFIANDFFGKVGLIEKVARKPGLPYRGLGRAALLMAALVGLEFLDTPLPPDFRVGPERVVCLATQGFMGPHSVFRGAGFDDIEFGDNGRAYGYVKRS